MRGAENQKCEWRMSLVYVDGPKSRHAFTFVERGVIATRPRDVKRPMGSDYWRVYVPKMLNPKKTKTLSELSEHDMNAYREFFATHNHFRQLGKWLVRG